LDLDKLRINRPSKFVFLCGGRTIDSARLPVSLRDYIYRIRPLQKRVNANIVLAEKAIQLYRDTSYSDLISFEEDIAKISSVVLLIAESTGSLAELGAFSTNDTIRKSLRIIVQQKYANAESFIRYGPIERIINGQRNFVGFYPWRITRTGRFVKASARLHYSEIRNFIVAHLNAVPTSELYRTHVERQSFYIIYWIIYLALLPRSLSIMIQVFLRMTSYCAAPRNGAGCSSSIDWIASRVASRSRPCFTTRSWQSRRIASASCMIFKRLKRSS